MLTILAFIQHLPNPCCTEVVTAPPSDFITACSEVSTVKKVALLESEIPVFKPPLFTLVRAIDDLDIIPLPTPKDLEVVIVRPNIEIKTADSRKVVKKRVKIEKMTQQSANLGSFVSSLYSEDYDLMSRSVIDQVVEPDRAVLIPEFDKVKMISKASGSIAAGISGSGPSIFSLSNNRVTSNNILDKISDHYNSMDIDFDGFISKVNSGGIKIIETK